MREYYVYIMSSQSRTLYTGMTSDLEQRVLQHKLRTFDGFTNRYKVTRLVWFETFNDVNQAIEAEKTIKGWRRSKKVEMIEEHNSRWEDLAADWYSKSQLQSED